MIFVRIGCLDDPKVNCALRAFAIINMHKVINKILNMHGDYSIYLRTGLLHA
jgi:hypothetical protein